MDHPNANVQAPTRNELGIGKPWLMAGLTNANVTLPLSDWNYPIPNSSMRSSGIPHFRQMMDAQSPHARGSTTGSLHWGQ